MKFKYKVTKKIGNKVIYTSKFMSFNRNRTFLIKVDDDSEKVQADVYLKDKWFKGYILKHYKSDAEIKFDKASLKSTQSLNSENTGHIKELKLSINAEVGWLLVKKEQTFDSLLKEIYKKVPTRSELDVFRHANAHISDLQDLNLNKKVMPGQIILITNKKHSKQLSEYKKLALEAERVFQFLCSQEGFDPEFYANNFELLMDYLAFAKEVQIARIEYLKTVEGHKESYCGEITLNKDIEVVNAVSIYSEKSKDKMDKIHVSAEKGKVKRLNENLLKQLDADIAALQKARQNELKNKTKLSNPKHNAEFRQKNYKLYQKIENTIAKNFIKMADNKEYAKILKNIVRDTSGVRSKDFLGGLKPVVKSMEHIGHATISLKLGLKLVLYFYIVDSATKVYGAYQTGDKGYTIKVATVETLNIGGGIVGGTIGATIGGATAGGIVGSQFGLILGIPTGGTSVVIAGAIGAVIGGVAGGFGGNYAGSTLGREITGVCR